MTRNIKTDYSRRAALAAAPAQPAAHMQKASPIFALAVQALNGVKAWRDCEGNDGFPDEVREQIDAVLSAFELRYTTHPTSGEPMGTDAQDAELVAEITSIDEYGPCLGWFKHWVGLPVGTQLYVRKQTK